MAGIIDCQSLDYAVWNAQWSFYENFKNFTKLPVMRLFMASKL